MIELLVVGGGSIGERHARCFLQTGRARVSVCDTSPAIRERLAKTYPLQSTFESLDEGLTHKFDAAVICTPAHLHIPMALRLAERGLHLFIEKPLSTRLDEDDFKQLTSLTADKSLAAGVAYVYRMHPALQAMKQALDANRFGRPVQIVVVAGQHFPFYRPAYRETYYVRRETGGGAIQDALTHLVNAAEWLVGPVTRLMADAEHCVLEGVEVEDTVHVLARHDHVLGSYSLNQHQPPNESCITVICEQGAARFEMHANRWLSCSQPGAAWTVENEFPLERDGLFTRQAERFLDQVAGTAQPACSLTEAAQTLRVNLAILASVDEARWITL